MLNIQMRLIQKLESLNLPDKLQLTFQSIDGQSSQVSLVVPYDDGMMMRTGRYYMITAEEIPAPATA